MSDSLRNIYIIDDDIDFSFYMSKLIDRAGWAKAIIFNDELKGLEACLKKPPACLILDLDLPVMKGEEICRILRSSIQFRDIPIIIVSRLPDARKKEMELLQIGADAYLEKPFASDEFLNTILINAYLVEDQDMLVPQGYASDKDSDEDDTISSQFYGYQIMEMIGGGGMGTVYKARQISLDRIVAIKVLSPQMRANASIAQRFEREAKILAQLSHPNIVQIYDVGSSNYAPFFVMEYVEGVDLEDRIKQSPLSLEEGVPVIKQVADALIYLHSKGIVHRDVKPSNIIIGRNKLIKLTDFGICRAQLPHEIAEFTQVLSIMGTPAFMAPEVHQGKPATELSDQYGYALTIWCTFTGWPPAKSSIPLNQARKDLPENISVVLERCMERNPAKRFSSMTEAMDHVLRACGASSTDQIAFPASLYKAKKKHPLDFHESRTRINPDNDAAEGKNSKKE